MNSGQVYVMPASPAQVGLWLLVELDPTNTAYNVPAAMRLTGPLDLAALERALHRLCERHEILRTTFTVDAGEVRQVIHPEPLLEVDRHDLRGLGSAAEEACRDACARRAAELFDLESGPLLRVHAFHLGEDDHVVSMLMHHIITDGWSMGVFIKELAVLYMGELAGGGIDALPPPALQYADFAVWHRDWLRGVQDEQLGHWRGALADRDLVLELPTDHARPRVPTFGGDRVTAVVDKDATDRMRRIAAGHGATAFMATHAALASVLARNASQQRVRIGVPSANRDHPNTQELIGFFANTLVVETAWDRGLTFGGLLGQVRERTAEALAHGDVPFGEVVRELGGRRDRSRSPLFQAMVAMDNAPGGFDIAPGLTAHRFDVPLPGAKFDLTLFVHEGPAGTELGLEYATDLFTRQTAQDLLDQVLAVLDAGLDAPERPLRGLLPVSEEQRRRLTAWAQGPTTAPEENGRATALELFAHQVDTAPDAPALVTGDRTISYAELDTEAMRIAAALADAGVGPHDVVGVAVPRSAELVAALLAVWKRGAAYVPLDPAQPAARLATMVADARPAAILETDGHAAALADGTPRLDVRSATSTGSSAAAAPADADGNGAQNLAYVLYTSGSTGRPKGVQITQSGLFNYVSWAAAEYCPGEPPVAPLHTTIGFDLTVTSLWVPLTTGGTVHLVDEDRPLDGLAELLTGPARPSLVKLTPAHLEALCRLLPEGALTGLSVCFVVGGEALAPSLVRRLFAVAPDARVVNEYGPTETAVGCSVADAVASDDLGDRPGMPIGRAIRNTRLYVVDEWFELVPVGVPGELLVGGSGVGRGYLGDPARTAASFVPDPFSQVPGSRLYRTGDVVRYLPDGQIEFLGRRDHQVKIRGQRIELGEVESALRGVEAVADAVAVAVEDHLGQARLAGYVAGGVDADAVRAAVGALLPDAMVPSAIVVLDALPLTPNGKVDRAGLPAPKFAELGVYVAPNTVHERRVAEVFADVLGVERVGLDDDFFALGGHSLLATQLMARVRERFSVELPLRALFEQPTVGGLAGLVGAASESVAIPLVPVERTGPVELSYAQQRMWFLHQLEPDSASYNVPAVVRLRGALDPERLRSALHAVALRHEVLRTVFAEVNGRPVQVVGDTPLIDFTQRDLRGSDDPEAAAQQIAAELAARPFDLQHGPLTRWVLTRHDDHEFLLALSMHHIVSDGWSVGVLLREVQAAYAGVSLPELPVQYADFAFWQRQWLESGVLEEQLAYWRTALAGAPPVLDLPTDHPRPAVPSYRGDHLRTGLSAETTAGLNSLAQKHGATLFMVLHAVWVTVLARRAGQDDVVIGVPVANRSRTETENLIGFFVNTLPIRSRIALQGSFSRLLDHVREASLDAFAHQDVPFERVVEVLAPERDLSRNPVFQAMFALQNAPQGSAGGGLEGVEMERLPLEEGMSKFDIMLLAEEPLDGDGSGLRITLEYATDLFGQETAQAVLDGFIRACEVLVASQGILTVAELTAVSAAERVRLVEEWNATDRVDVLGGVVQRVRALAVEQPGAVAVQDDGGSVTYGELVLRAGGLVGPLGRAGVRLGQRVALFLDRGVDAVAAVLGVLGVGAAYVPLDPRAPLARSAAILSDSGARVVVTSAANEAVARQLAEGVEESVTVVVVSAEVTAAEGAGDVALAEPLGDGDDLAYVIYTSGSTGRPKGAMVHRLGMDNHLLAKVEDLGLAGSDVVVQNASLTFDVSVWQMLSALVVGGRTVVFGDETALDATGLFERSSGVGVTVLEVVPSLLRAALDAWDTLEVLPDLAGLRWLVVTGEALAPDLCERWLARYPRIPLVNAYGPTECSDDVTHAVIKGTDAMGLVRAPIGRAIRNTRLYVVDEWFELVPVGVPGELLVGGMGVGRGYLDDPMRTAAAFVPDPFSEVPGARLYRTGDVVRYLPDGQIEFLGRRDHQVKIRGQRIELGEIESALRGVEAVADAVVVAVEDHLGQARLAGYVTGRVDTDTVRAAVGTVLPDAMVPSAIVVLDALPLTPNGKVDRAGLPAPKFAELGVYVAPGSVVERRVAEVFADVLGVERVGLDDDFFALGGHSLLATQLMARVRERFSVELPLRALFEQPTVGGLAGLVGAASESVAIALVPVERTGPVELSYAQQRMWFLHQLEPDSASYNVPAVVRLRGALDPERLRSALHAVALRHEVLRTVFAEVNGRPVQVVGDTPLIDFTQRDLRGSHDPEAAAQQIATELAARPFDLQHGPLLRWTLAELGDEEHLLAMSMHHIVSDGWSVGVLLREVQAAYAGVSLPELPVQYADFAFWQRQWLESGVLEEQLAYWRTALAGAPPVLDLPTDHPRPAVPSYRGDHLRTGLGAETTAGLNSLAQKHGATLFMVLHAVWVTVLARRAGQDDVVIGVPVANRSRTETENLIGFFVNTLPIRSRIAFQGSFSRLLGHVREASLDAFAHQDVPFERVVEVLAPERDLSRNPVFQAMFALQNAPQGSAGGGLEGVEMERLPLEEGMSKFDIMLLAEEPLDGDGSGLRITLEYATDLFGQETAQAVLDGFIRACEVLVASQGARTVAELTAISPAERDQLLGQWNATDRAERLGGIVRRIRAHATTHPETVAVQDPQGSVTYAELAARADHLARYLSASGVGIGDRVALHLDRGIGAITSVLGALGAGAAYVPLDVRAPLARSASVLADSGACHLLTDLQGLPTARQVAEAAGRPVEIVVVDGESAEVNAAEGAGDVVFAEPLGGDDDLAYVIYTSGSTGRPKGAMVHRLGMDNHLLAKVEDLGLAGSDVVVQNASLTFDVSVWQMLSALVVGGRTVVFGDETALDATGLFERSSGAGVTVLEVVPSLLRAALDAWDTLEVLPDLAGLRWLVVTGEALAPDLCERWLARYPLIPLVNAYGPTECSDDVTHAVIKGTDAMGLVRAPIGRAIRNTRLYVVDEWFELVPVGVPGELLVGGMGVGRGYLDDPVRTAAAFVPDPFSQVPGARLYRTGDVVRYLPDGQIEFLGRRDHQVKIRGQRIELGEIEAALRSVSDVTDAVVTATPDHLGQARLAGYVIGQVDTDTVRAAVGTVLPDAMVPSAIVVLDALPLTPNGKVDRAGLPAPKFAELGVYVAPNTVHERRVAEVFADVLGVERVGLGDDFFALGGHSLLATQLMARIRERFSVELPLRALFEQPTVGGLAGLVGAASESVAIPLVPVERTGPVELSYAQQRMWFLHQLEPDSASYNVPAVVRLRGALDPERLRSALHAVALRHEVLRTVFAEVNGRPVQVVGDTPLIDFTQRDLRKTADIQEAAVRLTAELAQRPFDLEQGPLLRWTLAELGDEDYLLAMSMHHIVSDGWSVGVLLREVQAAYAGVPLPELPVQYADFATWQRQWLASGALEEQLAYWREALSGAALVLELPADFPRPAVPSYRGAHVRAVLGESVTDALGGLAQRHGATLFMVLQAVWAALLARRAGQADVVVGVPIANRSRTETEGLIGFFVNTLPVRTRVDLGGSFGELLAGVREASLDAFAHQDVPFERLVEELVSDRDLSRNPVFQAMFTLQNAPRTGVDMAGIELSQLDVEDGTAKFDVMLLVDEAGGKLAVTLEYATDLFTPGTGQALLDDFVRGCEALAETSGELTVGHLTAVSAAERVRLVEEWNATDRADVLGGVVQRVRALAVERPGAVAVQDEGGSVTYGELVLRADGLVVPLGRAGVRLGERVALFLDRGVDAVAAVLGVLGVGAAYVPLDPRAPLARSAAILSDSGARVVVTSAANEAVARQLAEGVEESVTVVVVSAEVTAAEGAGDVVFAEPLGGDDDLAYVIYTSGSTGRPKGAMVHRLGMDNHLLAKVEDLGLAGSDVVVQNASLTFDVSVWQMLSALVVGGRTVVFGDETALDATGLFERSSGVGVTVLEVVPSLLRAALDAWDTLEVLPDLAGLRWLVVTGEALAPDLCERWLARYPRIPLVNAYGPTECSDDVTHAVIKGTGAMGLVRAPIGRAIRNTRLYVVDEWFELVPVGVPGELLVGGMGVGRGYLDDPVRTAASFVPDPFSEVPGARLYRTGDVVRYLPDGQIEFLGRRDHQVKIRGQRIELGEVESALRGVEGVADAVAVEVEDHLGQARLAGYVTGRVDTDTVRAAVGTVLPDAMVPSAIVVLDALPLTPNGKVDRAGLSAPKFAELGVYVAPNTVHEHLVAMLFTEVLGVERVGLDDDFFALGGHSLLATQLMARIRERFGIDLPLRTLFEEPGLRELAARVEQAEAEQTDGAALDDLERLLSEVESMNDETAQRLAMDETERDSVVDGMVGNGKILDTEGEK